MSNGVCGCVIHFFVVVLPNIDEITPIWEQILLFIPKFDVTMSKKFKELAHGVVLKLKIFGINKNEHLFVIYFDIITNFSDLTFKISI